MDNTIERTKKYFDAKSEKLEKIKLKKQKALIFEIKKALENKLYGRVLDIGCGENFYYSIDNINILVAVDIFFSLLANEKTDKRYCIVSDARYLALKDNFFDCVLILNLLHHLAADCLIKTETNLLNCFVEAKRVLKESGRIFIIEAFCNKMIGGLEKVFYKSLFFAFKVFDKPMVYYFPFHKILEFLFYLGFKNIKLTYLNDRNIKLCPFDAKIGLPLRYFGLKYILVEAIK